MWITSITKSLDFRVSTSDEVCVPSVSLTPAQFSRLCDRLGLTAHPGAGRVEPRMPVMIALATDGELAPPIKSVLRDLSTKSATLTHPEVISQGQQIVFYIEATRLLTKVETSKRFSDGTAIMTLSFLGLAEPQMRPVSATQSLSA